MQSTVARCTLPAKRVTRDGVKLSSEQSDQLEQLCARLQVSAFAEAERGLEALETRPSPALIPALLPAFVPVALRGRAHEQGWVNRALRMLQAARAIGQRKRFGRSSRLFSRAARSRDRV